LNTSTDYIPQLTFEVEPPRSEGLRAKDGKERPGKAIKGFAKNKAIANKDLGHPQSV
jgi:hypothetical protein